MIFDKWVDIPFHKTSFHRYKRQTPQSLQQATHTLQKLDCQGHSR